MKSIEKDDIFDGYGDYELAPETIVHDYYYTEINPGSSSIKHGILIGKHPHGGYVVIPVRDNQDQEIMDQPEIWPMICESKNMALDAFRFAGTFIKNNEIVPNYLLEVLAKSPEYAKSLAEVILPESFLKAIRQ